MNYIMLLYYIDLKKGMELHNDMLWFNILNHLVAID